MPNSTQLLQVCIHCKAFCCTLVRPPVTQIEKQDILDAGFKDYFIKVKNGIFTIKAAENGTCPYLKNDYSCEIHHVKPKLCKVWPIIPFYKNNNRGYIVIKCPLFSYLSKNELQQAHKEAEEIPLSIIKHLWNISPDMKKKYKQFEYEEI